MKYTKKIIALTLLLAFTSFSFSPSIQAESLTERAKAVKQKMNALRGELSGVTQRYTSNVEDLEYLRDEIYINEQKLSKATTNLKVNQNRINIRAGSMYRYDKATFLDVILSSKSWNDFLVSWDFINRISGRDGQVIKKIKRIRGEIKRAQRKLSIAEKEKSRIVKLIANQKDEVEEGLAKQKKLMAGIEEEIDRLNRMPKLVPSYSGPIRASGWVFPVASPYSFSNDWGAPRSGGRRHKGNDIMTSMGNPTYAVVSGSVSNMSGGKAGLWQILRGDDGNQYWYMHQSSFALSGRVSQGQVIGYAGNTGNAAGGPPHVHFEFHPGGGSAVNPYPYLIAAQ